MDLVERYLQAVRFWLPRRQKEDIIAELSEDLHSRIEEKQAELGRTLSEVEVESILKQCGPPRMVANRYQPKRYLIGPVVFPIYWLVLRMALLWSLGPWLLVWGVLVIFAPSYRADHPGAALLGTLQAAWWVGFSLAAAITLAFAVMERVQAKSGMLERWDPRDLPPLVRREPTVRRSDSLFGLIFAGVFLAWWLAAPHDWRLVFGPASGIFSMSPALHGYYIPIILLTLAGMAQAGINLLRPQWTWLPPSTRLVTTAVSAGIVRSMTAAYPYVVLSDGAGHVARYDTAAMVVNQTILGSLAITGIVMLIMVVVYAIQCIQVFRRWMEGERNLASSRI